MTDANRAGLDIEKCRALLRSPPYGSSENWIDEFRAALALLASTRETLAELLSQIESCDGTAQLNVDEADAMLAVIPDGLEEIVK